MGQTKAMSKWQSTSIVIVIGFSSQKKNLSDESCYYGATGFNGVHNAEETKQPLPVLVSAYEMRVKMIHHWLTSKLIDLSITPGMTSEIRRNISSMAGE